MRWAATVVAAEVERAARVVVAEAEWAARVVAVLPEQAWVAEAAEAAARYEEGMVVGA